MSCLVISDFFIGKFRIRFTHFNLIALQGLLNRIIYGFHICRIDFSCLCLLICYKFLRAVMGHIKVMVSICPIV